MPVLLIINPNAKKGKGVEKANEIVKIFRCNNMDVSVAFTQGPGHARTLAYEAVQDGFDIIIAAGGDGCMNEVINGIMSYPKHNHVKFGIIPIGRGNDYAYSLGLPTDIVASTELILAGNVRRVDVGRTINNISGEVSYFLNGNGYGFEPLINYKASLFKHLNGMASYIAGFLRMLISPPKPYTLDLYLDGELAERNLRTQQISICLGRRMGSTFMLAPSASIDDGLFDVMYTRHPLSSFKLLSAALQFLRGVHVNNKKTFCLRNVRKVDIKSISDNLTSHVDGEMIALENGRDFSIEILEKGIAVFAP